MFVRISVALLALGAVQAASNGERVFEEPFGFLRGPAFAALALSPEFRCGDDEYFRPQGNSTTVEMAGLCSAPRVYERRLYVFLSRVVVYRVFLLDRLEEPCFLMESLFVLAQKHPGDIYLKIN